MSRTQIMKVHHINHVADFHDLCPRQVRDFVRNLFQTLSPTFPVHCNGLNSIRATQVGLSWTCHGLCCKHLNMSRWFVAATFVICVHDFPCGEVLVKVGIMEFGLNEWERCSVYCWNKNNCVCTVISLYMCLSAYVNICLSVCLTVHVDSIVSENGASVYSASELAQKELPIYDVSLRGAGISHLLVICVFSTSSSSAAASALRHYYYYCCCHYFLIFTCDSRMLRAS